MKKIMMFAVAAICAVAAQAASIEWGSGTMYLPGGTTKAGKGDVAGYVYILTASDYNSLDLSNSKSVYDTYKAKTAAQTGSSSKTGIVNMTTTGYNVGDTVYALLIYETAGTDGQYILAKGYDTINDVGTQSNLASGGLAATGTSWAPKSGGDTPGGGTPEPTSGLLLMIGAGVLALRRRVQK